MKIILLDDQLQELTTDNVEYFSYVFVRTCLILLETAK